MKEFRLLLQTLGKAQTLLEPLRVARDQLMSVRLRQLVSTDDEVLKCGEGEDDFAAGLLPANFKAELAKFAELIIWKTVSGAKGEIPEPKAGVDPNFDSKNKAVNDLKEQLNMYLLAVRKQFGNDRRVQYSHAKFRYELEVPLEHVKGNKKPKDWEL